MNYRAFVSLLAVMTNLIFLKAAAQSPAQFQPNRWMPSKASLPLLRKGIQTHQQIAYDRAGDNYDHEYFGLYKEQNSEIVLFDAYGPGMVSRHHMNIWHAPNKGINIRYYFDDEQVPRIDMDVNTFFTFDNPLGIFTPPFAVYGEWDFRVMYCPMYFKKRLKITLSKEPGGPGLGGINPWKGRADSLPGRRSHWYQFTYQLYSEPQAAESWHPSKIESLKDAKLHWLDSSWTRTDFGKEKLLLISGNGEQHYERPGVIQKVVFDLPTLDNQTLQKNWLAVQFDDHVKPDVLAPIHAFFGIYPDSLQNGFTNLFSHYDPLNRQLACSYVMPFWNKVRVWVQDNKGNIRSDIRLSVSIDTAVIAQYPKDKTGYFQAFYQKQSPRTEGYDYVYLNQRGWGHIIGHVALRYNTSMEENERTYFDGNLTPQIQGNGFEDDQGFGWGLKRQVYPLFGAPVAIGGSGALYRYFLPDLYCYYAHVVHGHQVYGPATPLGHEGQYAVGAEESTTFFYGKPEPAERITDSLDVGKTISEQAHNYQTIQSTTLPPIRWWYDGDHNNVLHAAPGTVDEGRRIKQSAFTVRIDPANEGIRIRRRTDKANGRQLADVYIDDKLVTERPWYTVDYDTTFKNIRWFDTNMDIPKKYTAGKSKVRIRLEYKKGDQAGIDEYFYWIFSYTR